MGRKSKDIEEVKTEKVEVRLTYAEKMHLMNICSQKGGISISKLIRLKLLEESQ